MRRDQDKVIILFKVTHFLLRFRVQASNQFFEFCFSLQTNWKMSVTQSYFIFRFYVLCCIKKRTNIISFQDENKSGINSNGSVDIDDFLNDISFSNLILRILLMLIASQTISVLCVHLSVASCSYFLTFMYLIYTLHWNNGVPVILLYNRDRTEKISQIGLFQ